MGATYSKDEVTLAVRSQRARTIELLRGLPEADWERIVVPRWRVREVAGHLVSTDEASLTGRLLMLGLRQVPVSKLEAWNDEQVKRWADRPIEKILRGLERWGRRIAGLARVVPGRAAGAGLPTPFGKVSLLWLGMMRVYDEWIHLEDVRRTFGMASDDAPHSIEPVARHLLAGLEVQTASRIPEGASGTVSLACHDLDLPPLRVDLGAKTFDLAGGDADARVSGRASDLVMTAARRYAWREIESAGSLKVEGSREVAEAFLDALLFV